jgi:tRNA modification GTPase
VGVVRASGPLSSHIPKRLFPGIRSTWQSHHMRHGHLRDPASGQIVDDALCCLMTAPQSYTGEDVVEIYCHGSPLVLDRVISLCLAEGCRVARPGEFTLRAFLNGRLDLSQAEAVLDVVQAQSNAGLELALEQLGGWLSRQLEPLWHELLGVLAQMEAMVDFVEDDIPPQLDDVARDKVEVCLRTLEDLLAGSEQGIVLREGVTLAIVGSPNVGKSSIMNALLGMERSIVTPIAGTTRDTVEENLQVHGLAFRTIDTAGITSTDDPVERIGVERSRRALARANVVLLVLDRSRGWTARDDFAAEAVAASLKHSSNDTPQRLVVALNKSDLPLHHDAASRVQGLRAAAIVQCSALTLDGLPEVREALQEAALGGSRQEHVIGSVRHQDALRRSADALRRALCGYRGGTPLDLVSFDVRAAVHALGEITGASADDELLDRVFRDFCIGK